MTAAPRKTPAREGFPAGGTTRRSVQNNDSTRAVADNLGPFGDAPALWVPRLFVAAGDQIYGAPLRTALTDPFEAYPDACIVPYVCNPPRRLNSHDINDPTVRLAWAIVDVDGPRKAFKGQVVPDDVQAEHEGWVEGTLELASTFSPAPVAWLTPNGIRLLWALAPGAVTPSDYTPRCIALLDMLEAHGMTGLDRACTDWTRLQRLPHGRELVVPPGGVPTLTLPRAPADSAPQAALGAVSGPVTECTLYRMLNAADPEAIGDVLGDIAYVRCPWDDEHSNAGAPIDSSTAILADRQGKNMGVFVCKHAHCTGRGNKELLALLKCDSEAAAILAEHDRVVQAAASALLGRPANDNAQDPERHPGEDCTGLKLNRLTGWPWILQKGQFYWLHHIDEASYRQEVPTAELVASVARNLDKQIEKDDRTRKELDNRWIKPVRELRSTYTARANTYDPTTNTLTLAALRWTARPATFHAHIDRWLRALFGASYDAAAQWIASLCDLSRPAPALYMAGEHELGKSLLVAGLAQLWCQAEAATLAEVISDFNEATASCPLVFSDEGFPPGLDFNQFREMITAHSRRVNQKFRAKVSVEGCARIVIAANNDDALRYQKTGTLTRADLDAIDGRLLVVLCDRAARDEVAKLDTAAVASHELAEHALWLAQTVPLQPKGHRMAAAPGGGERILQNVMAGRHAEILATVAKAREGRIETWVENKVTMTWEKKVMSAADCGVFEGLERHPGRTLVNTTRLFDVLAANKARVTLADVKEFCEAHRAVAGSVQFEPDGKTNLKCRVLDTDSLNEAIGKLD